jgi:hypothetical protein
MQIMGKIELFAQSSDMSQTWRIYCQGPVEFVHQISGVKAIGNHVSPKIHNIQAKPALSENNLKMQIFGKRELLLKAPISNKLI